MVSHAVKNLPKNTFEIVIDIPWKMIGDEYAKAFDQLASELEVEGFRKGKAPKSVAEKHIKKETVYQRVIQNLLPEVYEEIIKKEGLRPVINPRIELVKAKENEDWQIKMVLAGRPVIILGDYKKIIKELKSDKKKEDIWVPGKDKGAKEQSAKAEEDKQKILNEILSALVKKTKVEISDLIIEEELNARLARLLDEVQKIGLTVDSYLKSKGTTIEELKKKYTQEIEEIHALEFILNEIADKESIQVEPKELEVLYSKITDKKEREEAQRNAYFYASVMRKQKTLDFLLSL